MASFKTHPGPRVICLVPIFLGLCLPAHPAEFAGGTGEAKNPYQIATAGQLVAIGSDPNLLNKHFTLVADIDLDPNLPGGRVFSEAVIAPGDIFKSLPLPTPFTGSLDGRGYAVRNLTVVSTHSYIGLFGRIEKDGRVERLKMMNVRIKSTAAVDPNETWGIPCATGALAGINRGTVSCCTSSGVVAGTQDVGGLVGCNAGTVSDCYSTASVAGELAPGGLVGLNYGSLVRCYSVGPVSGPDAAGLVGSVMERGSVQNCFWDVETSGCHIGCAGKGLSTTEMTDAEVYSLHGWASPWADQIRSDDWVWAIDDGRDYPRLEWEGTPGQRIPWPRIDWFEGRGTQDDPYRIVTAEQLKLLGTASILWDKYFVLCADLDLAAMAYKPVGVCPGTGFSGSFDGRGHILSNLTPDGSLTADYFGLFGCVESGGRIRRVGLRKAAVIGHDHVGALAGFNAGTIDSCFADANVAGDNWVGGLVGLNVGKVLRSYSVGSVTGDSDPGGLIGSHEGRLVAYCYAAGAVKSSQGDGRAEGLIGRSAWHSYYDGSDVQQVYNYYLQPADDVQPSDEDSWNDHPGTALIDGQMRLRSSFVEWDFYGEDTDGMGDHWFMPLGEYPVLSWQTDVTGLRAVPDVRHASLDRVRELFAEADLVLGNISKDYDPSVATGRAILARPHGSAPLGQAVDVVQSLGPYNWSKNPGQGTPAAPYQIQTAGQLISTTWWTNDCHFVLMDDISLSGCVYAFSGCVLPVLRGSFDGQNHRVSDFEGILTTFFDDIYPGATLCNLTLDRVVILNAVGGALSYWNGGNVVNCHVIGRVAGYGSHGLGGLTGSNTGTVVGCSMQGAVKGTANTWGLGGLVGTNTGTVEECRVRLCEVSGENATWGLAGLVGDNRATMQNCYCEAQLVRPDVAWDVAGLVGDNSGTVAFCWASCSVQDLSGTRTQSVLIDSNTGVITSCYLPAGSRNNGLGTILSEANMCRRSSFVGWDFGGDAADGTADVWTICEGEDYPRLRWEQVDCK